MAYYWTTRPSAHAPLRDVEGGYQLAFPGLTGIVWHEDPHPRLEKLAEDRLDGSRVAARRFGPGTFSEQIARTCEPWLHPTGERYEIWCGPRSNPLLWERPLLHVQPEPCRVLARLYLNAKPKRSRLRLQYATALIAGLLWLGYPEMALLVGMAGPPGLDLTRDFFIDTDNTQLNVHDPNWIYVGADTGFSIESNSLRPHGGTGGGSFAYYNGKFPARQFVRTTLVAKSSANNPQLGIAVRMSKTQLRCFEIRWTGLGEFTRFGRLHDDVFTDDWGTYTTPTPPHITEIRAHGSTITALLDNVVDAGFTTNPATSSALGNGEPGVVGFGFSSTPRIGSWVAGLPPNPADGPFPYLTGRMGLGGGIGLPSHGVQS